MHSVEDYARQWIKHKREERQRYSFRMGYGCEVVDSYGSIGTLATSIFRNSNVAKHRSFLHNKYVVVPADKVPNNVVYM